LEVCPLCNSTNTSLFCSHETGSYHLCESCHLVFVLKQVHLNEADEKSRYDLHTNNPSDAGYRKYLSKVANPVIHRVKKNAKGLDFGSGPGPTLSLIFEEAGYTMNIYDHFYAKHEEVLTENYDFITSTEVVEHLYQPKKVLDGLWSLINEGGLLCLLTQPYPRAEEFASWYYKKDPTHVCFFSLETMQFLAKIWQAELEVISKDIFIFTKGKVQ